MSGEEDGGSVRVGGEGVRREVTRRWARFSYTLCASASTHVRD